MDIRQLEQFVEVARTGGFARAAKALNLSQPSLTRNIAALERSLGSALFQRTPKGAMLTEAGNRLLPHASAILDEMDRAHAAFAEGRDEAFAQVRIGVSPNILFDLLPEVIPQLLACTPALRVVIQTGTFEQLADAARNRDCDVMVCLVPEIGTLNSRDLMLEPLRQEVAIGVARAGHPVANADLAELSHAHWAVPHQLSLSYRFESTFFRRGLEVPPQRLNTSSLTLMRRAVLEWDLLGMLPLRFVRDDLESGRMVQLAPAELHLGFTVGLLQTQAASRHPATMAVVEVLRAAARRTPGAAARAG